jgi:Tannase and feruloyl esterase
MVRRCRHALGAVLAISMVPRMGQAHAPLVQLPTSAQCTMLELTDLSTVEDTPTQITAATWVTATTSAPAYCQVTGYVSPQVGFIIGLPIDWNGKFLERGCGGDCGSIAEAKCTVPIQRGYACIDFDAGHSGSGGLWALNNPQALVDFGYRAAHVTALAGKAITERFYNRAPRYAYFWGSSTGGRQALVEAQRFPWDFDGIISGAPWINDTDSAMAMVWANRALAGEDGTPLLTRADLQLVHHAALARCDMDDGIRDGIIGNPAACQFDPHALVCTADHHSGCLTQAQADAVQKVYNGPMNSKGERTYSGGPVPGSEMGWVDDGVLDFIRSDGRVAGSESWALMYFRYMVMPPAGAGWKLSDFDFDEDYKRFGTGVQEPLLNAANPDLRKFKAAGGKLIIYQGWNDQSDLPGMTIDYYETVEKTMGGRAATEAFSRLFVVPGMLHVSGGDGAYAIDYLTYLEKWVEKHQPPNVMIGAHVDDQYVSQLGRQLDCSAGFDMGSAVWSAKFMGALTLRIPLDPTVPIAFTRPIYPYPLRAEYKGSGNPDDAVNFLPTEKQTIDGH